MDNAFDQKWIFWDITRSGLYGGLKCSFDHIIYIHKDAKIIAKCQKINNLKYFVLPSTLSTDIWHGDTRGHCTVLFLDL